MATRHRRDAVAPRLLASNPPVAVVVPYPERICAGGCGARRGGGAAAVTLAGEHKLCGMAAGENQLESDGLAPVGCQAVLALDGDDARGEPAKVLWWKPLACVVGTLTPARAAVHFRERRGSG